MGTNFQQSARGFTIIEVMLVVAITGVLAMALLGGWTTMINTQRYRDSVKTTQAFIQEQYAQVYNVQNAREKSLRCNDSAVTDDGAGVGQLRAQSECVLMGRYIHLDGGDIMRVAPIVGQKPAVESAASDILSIQEYKPNVSNLELDLTRKELTIPWGASAVTAVAGSEVPLSAAIAIIRSPSSGIVHTYAIATANDGNLLPMIDLVKIENEQRDLPICLDPKASFSGGRMGVIVKARASAQTFIQTITDRAGVC